MEDGEAGDELDPSTDNSVVTHWLAHVERARYALTAKISEFRLCSNDAYKDFIEQALSSEEPFLYATDTPSSPRQSWEFEPLFAAYRQLQSALLFLGGVSPHALGDLLADRGEATSGHDDALWIYRLAIATATRESVRRWYDP